VRRENVGAPFPGLGADLLPATLLYRPDAPADAVQDPGRDRLRAGFENSIAGGTDAATIRAGRAELRERRAVQDPDERVTSWSARAVQAAGFHRSKGEPGRAESVRTGSIESDGTLCRSQGERTGARAEAERRYPVEHVGYSLPVPEGCSCEECYVRDMQRDTFAAGAGWAGERTDALDVLRRELADAEEQADGAWKGSGRDWSNTVGRRDAFRRAVHIMERAQPVAGERTVTAEQVTRLGDGLGISTSKLLNGFLVVGLTVERDDRA
jgi:hypothetical protein